VAIDTAEKRKSAAGVPFLPLGPGVTPNSAKDQEWRQESAWSYSGILAKVTGSTEVVSFDIDFARVQSYVDIKISHIQFRSVKYVRVREKV
jgi:hypothetical protein